MGTRNLTMVINKVGETKIAQYGQWDGYPSGQGVTILSFLYSSNLDFFNEKLSKLSWFDKDELNEIDFDKYPWIDRDLGGEILNAIYLGEFQKFVGYTGDYESKYQSIKCDITKLVNNEDFAGDSLFCEWAYVVDLEKNTFEVYKGFQESPIDEDERFYNAKTKPNNYYPVKLLKKYNLDNLPSIEDFLNDFTETEEE